MAKFAIISKGASTLGIKSAFRTILTFHLIIVLNFI